MPTDKPHKPSNLYDVEKPDNDLIRTEPGLVIPLIEEKVKVGKMVVETGRVKLLKTVEEHEETVTVPLIEEEITVSRQPMNRYVEEAPAVRQEGETTIYPVIKEVLVIEKKLMLVEEIHVTKRQRTTISSEVVNLRTELLSIEREITNEGRPG